MKYFIILHGLGQDAPERVTVDPDKFSKSLLEYNLAILWAWNQVIDSDGPCVAITWSD